MQDLNLELFREHTKDVFPEEACGLLVNVEGKEQYIQTKNISLSPEDDFIIDPLDYANAEDKGEILAICHSHPNLGCEPSQADLVACEETKKPWYILSWTGNQLYYWEPSNYEAPLTGRQFSYGVLDCCSLIRDYYSRTLDIHFTCKQGLDNWWDKGENRYLDNYEAQGFINLIDSELKKHDVLLIKLVSSVPNHAAVIIDNDKILHHIHGRLSSIDVYGGYWRKHTTHHLRHKSLC